jgi:predicted ArsR family transcriptional regulator
VGVQLAESLGGEAKGSLRERVHAAATALVTLGGDVDVVDDAKTHTISGYGCPLAQSVREHPETCRAVRAMVQHVSGAHTEERCEHGDRPQCRFRVS